MKSSVLHVLLHWLPLAIAIIGLSGIIFFGTQQIYRQTLNDPQIEIVHEARNALEQGARAEDLVPSYALDIDKSLSPFIGVYDKDGNPLASSGKIDGNLPTPPKGIFENAAILGENRVTWQPTANTRIALVVQPIETEAGGFVLAGRNMQEGESRIKQLGEMVKVGGLATLLAVLILEFLGDFLRRRAVVSSQKTG